jgi:hypothetical protein
MQRSLWRGHPIIWANRKWIFEDNYSPIPSYGGKVRPCKECGRLFEGSCEDEPDPCLGILPGVDNACCGHGDPTKAYIRFTNGIILKGFTVERK